MNKKAFIGATLITATTVGVLVYYRHKLLARVDRWLDDGEQVNKLLDIRAEDPSDEEVQRFEDALREAGNG